MNPIRAHALFGVPRPNCSAATQPYPTPSRVGSDADGAVEPGGVNEPEAT
jgi:hypothetical protein